MLANFLDKSILKPNFKLVLTKLKIFCNYGMNGRKEIWVVLLK